MYMVVVHIRNNMHWSIEFEHAMPCCSERMRCLQSNRGQEPNRDASISRLASEPSWPKPRSRNSLEACLEDGQHVEIDSCTEYCDTLGQGVSTYLGGLHVEIACTAVLATGTRSVQPMYITCLGSKMWIGRDET